MNRFKLIFPALFLICLALNTLTGNQAYAQSKQIMEQLKIPDSGYIQFITTLNGSTNIGRIVAIGNEEISFQTDSGTLTIPIPKIKKIRQMPVASINNGEYWFPNPNTTRLFFAPTGRMLKKGDGYFQDIYLFFVNTVYGLTDNLTIGGGTSIFPGVDIDKQIFYLMPKVGLKATENLNLAAGALAIRIPFDDKASAVGILYGVGTYGKPDASITAGLGYGFVDQEVASKPMIILGSEKRISRRITLVSENWIFPGVDNPLVSYGVRFFGEGLSVDMAFFNTIGENFLFPGIPYIDFVFCF
ncbi:MAG: hypothetical protein ABH886_08115 [Candidatus Desantisbacteria bacterium]